MQNLMLNIVITLQILLGLFIFGIYLMDYRKFRIKKDWTGLYFCYKVFYLNPIYNSFYYEIKRFYIWRPKKYTNYPS